MVGLLSRTRAPGEMLVPGAVGEAQRKFARRSHGVRSNAGGCAGVGEICLDDTDMGGALIKDNLWFSCHGSLVL